MHPAATLMSPSFRERVKQVVSPQAAAIFDHLCRAGSITNAEANAVHRCRSVSRRITEIHKAGVLIRKEQKRDVTGQRYVRYCLD